MHDRATVFRVLVQLSIVISQFAFQARKTKKRCIEKPTADAVGFRGSVALCGPPLDRE
ncbi:hypothetical protein GL4_2803 [Methyloceanibacter caenitepidi]|uniref:Uncharacterized protein n=1 Tax=Methyloceanibacter caenitepidi TaxID=1384459 RepID=A0A0A8K6U0_9HYPH|nr:hypothetical protein GL4_2803 [Methyloceanibacter caenitepidi]